jgi:enamine deaminase RidA (YjgF/YER057c/UK114 family)
VFATGQMATDPATGSIAADVLRSRAPLSGKPKHLLESARVFDNLEQVLAAGGSSLARIVRSDQYFTTWAAVSHYHTERVSPFASRSSLKVLLLRRLRRLGLRLSATKT